MENKKEIVNSVKRLEQLKQATIVNYLDDINLDEDLDLYNTMIHAFVDGKLDDEFYSPNFQDMNLVEKRKLQELGRKYLSLCFYDGNPNYWTDSIEGLSLEDYDLICMKIFDNYNFILEIIKKYGVEVVEQLREIQDSEMFNDNVAVDYLRDIFDDDYLLGKTLFDVSRKDGNYEGLKNSQKAVLFMYPEGILFEKNGKVKRRVKARELKDKIINYVYSSDDFSNDLEDVNDSYFENIISNINLDYLLGSKSDENVNHV